MMAPARLRPTPPPQVRPAAARKYRKRYVVVYVGGARWVPEHRLVMEEAIGRPLRREEVVHHINGVRDDNRLENLELHPSKRSHNRAHRRVDRKAIVEAYLAGEGTRVIARRMGTSRRTTYEAVKEAGVLRTSEVGSGRSR
jgi:hypothetical protein